VSSQKLGMKISKIFDQSIDFCPGIGTEIIYIYYIGGTDSFVKFHPKKRTSNQNCQHSMQNIWANFVCKEKQMADSVSMHTTIS